MKEYRTTMSTDVTLPALGESVTEGTVTRWLKQVGDAIAADEPLLEVSTDKVDTEIPSPAAGVLLEIRAQEDDTVEVGAVLAVIGEENEAGSGSAPARTASPSPRTRRTPRSSRTTYRPSRRRAARAPAVGAVGAPRSPCPRSARASPRAPSAAG